MQAQRREYRNIWLLTLPLTLASCDMLHKWLPGRHVAHRSAPAVAQYSAADFTTHLSLADLALAGGQPAEADVDVLQAYTAPPGRAKHAPKRPASSRLDVVVLECKKGGVRHRLAAPLDKEDDLLEVFSAVDAAGCTLHALWPATATVVRGAPMKFGDTPQDARAVHSRLAALAHGAEHYAPLREAMVELRLARIFTDAHVRDAAYISIENAQQALAEAEKNPENKNAITPLLHQLEGLEAEVHQSMPFTF